MRRLFFFRVVSSFLALSAVAALQTGSYYFTPIFRLENFLISVAFLAVLLGIFWMLTYFFFCATLSYFRVNQAERDWRIYVATESLNLYFCVFAAFAFYYYAGENPGANFWANGPNGAELVVRGEFTALGLRAAIKSISYATLTAVTINVLGVLYLVLGFFEHHTKKSGENIDD